MNDMEKELMGKMNERCFYNIQGFFPRGGMSGFGFGIDMKSDIARRALSHPMSQKYYDHLQRIGKDIILNSGWEKEFIRKEPYVFAENKEGKVSSLLHYCEVPGDACDLGIDGMQLGRFMDGGDRISVKYGPHNVDNTRQAYALLSLWLTWANGLEGVLKE